MSRKQKKVIIHTPKEIAGIRLAARKTAKIRDKLCNAVCPGMTTKQLDNLAKQFFKEEHCTSAFYNYCGFPGQICISVNEQIVHGIGNNNHPLKDGDIVSIDVGANYKGYIGDTARTVYLPPANNPQIIELLTATENSLYAGIKAAIAGNHVNDISIAIENSIKPSGFSIVRDYTGHGCGCQLHEEPEIPNFSQNKKGPKLRPGMVLAIEPMINIGTNEIIIAEDNWTVSTRDGKLSAHFEHMILITEKQPEILTWQKTV